MHPPVRNSIRAAIGRPFFFMKTGTFRAADRRSYMGFRFLNGLSIPTRNIKNSTSAEKEVTRTGIDYQKGVAGALPGEQQSPGLLYLDWFDSRTAKKKSHPFGWLSFLVNYATWDTNTMP